MTPARPDQVLAELLAAMGEAKLDAALLGGYAVVTWGVPRATFDVDALVEADDERLRAAFAALERRGFAVDEVYKTGWRDHVRDMPLVKVQVFREERVVCGDLFLVATPLQRSAFARCRTIELPGIAGAVRVVSPADLILFKLLAGRPKDRLDVQNVLAVQGVPDAGYLREWAKRLGVEALLDEALEAAGLER
jgi:hypothetical protein